MVEAEVKAQKQEVVTNTKQQQKVQKKPMNPGTIYVGDKPVMNYATSISMMFTTRNISEISIEARGKYVMRAIDSALTATERFLQNVVIAEVKLATETFTNKDGNNARVSTIKIVLKKKE